jgi:hypothetical protein
MIMCTYFKHLANKHSFNLCMNKQINNTDLGGPLVSEECLMNPLLVPFGIYVYLSFSYVYKCTIMYEIRIFNYYLFYLFDQYVNCFA